MQPTTVLVTGANGFVGSHILEALTQREGIVPLAACRDRRDQRARRLNAGLRTERALERSDPHANERNGRAPEEPDENVQADSPLTLWKASVFAK